jgi:hypothetical protein
MDDVAAEGEVVGEVGLEEVSLETGMLGYLGILSGDTFLTGTSSASKE